LAFHKFLNLHQWEEKERKTVERMSGISKAHGNVDKLYPYVVRKVYGSRVDSALYELVCLQCNVCGETKTLRIPMGRPRKHGLEKLFPLLSALFGAFSLFVLGLPLGAAAIIFGSASLEREGWNLLGVAGVLLGLVGLLLAVLTMPARA